MQSMAYDLSRFEARANKPKATEQKAKELKVVKGKGKKSKLASSISPVTAVVLAVVTVSVCAFMLYTKAKIDEAAKAITRTNNEITQLMSEQVRLDSELNAIMSRGNIEQKALALGMYEADKLQVECVEVNQGDRIEILADNRNIFEKIGDFFINLF